MLERFNGGRITETVFFCWNRTSQIMTYPDRSECLLSGQIPSASVVFLTSCYWDLIKEEDFFMNKIYKVVWSKVRNAYVVVSELAKRNSKTKSQHTSRVSHSLLSLAVVSSLAL